MQSITAGVPTELPPSNFGLASRHARRRLLQRYAGFWLLGLICLAMLAMTGCSTGGYAGGTLSAISASQATIDASQRFPLTATASPGLTVGWTLTGSSCGTASGCGALSSSTGGTITYTAPASLDAAIQVQVVAKAGNSTETSTITVNPAPSISGNPPAGTVGIPYTATLTASGGTAPLTLSQTGGSLPAGLSFNAATGVISGTPTTTGTSTAVFSAVDASAVPFTVSANKSITINTNATTAVTVTGAPPAGTVGVAYSSQLNATGGTAPYTFALNSGALPQGLTLSSAGLISGTPTSSGSFAFTARATDTKGVTGSASFTIAVAAGTSSLTLTPGSLPAGTVGTPYSSTIGVTGGTAPYSCTVSSGTLPAGLTLGANCLVSGTPTAAGSATLQVAATDSSSPQNSGSGPETITINPATSAGTLTITPGSLPNGTVGTPYASTIGVTGGTAPYSCTISSGTLPAGLTLGTNCLVSGTPTAAGSATLQVSATDLSSPQLAGSGPETITINPTSSLTIGNPPAATAGQPYTGTVPVSGGTGPYTCKLQSGTLPAGLTLGANCIITGTPVTGGSVNVMVTATDSGNPPVSTTGPVTVAVNPAALSISTGTLPDGTVGQPYSSSIGVTGGTSPYSCTVTAGTLPAGLTLGANCLVSGTPTADGTVTVQVKATDSGSPQQTTNGPQTITINPAPALTISSPPNGTVGTPYTGTIPVTGGTAPYSCTVTAGTLPAGLTLGTNCAVSGTPTQAGTSTLTVQATDSKSPATTQNGQVSLTINPSTTLTVGNPPAGTVGTPFTGSIPVSGGTGPYSCTVASGTLPAGLTLASDCTVSGTPTQAGSTPVNVTVTDSSQPPVTSTTPVVFTINPPPALAFTGTLPNGVVGVPYSQVLAATGGVGPYTYAVTAGTLPAGLTLGTDGTVSGTPTTPGASSFTVTATDSENPAMTASLPLTLLITYAPAANNGLLSGPYAYLFQGYDDVAVGVLAYQTASIGSFTADGKGAITAGEQDSNHQGSNPTGNTVATTRLLGTYTVNADNRGLLTITTFNTDGSVDRTTTYAISVKAPVSPATTSAAGSFIEYDGGNLVGTRGSGSFLQQTPAAATAGLSGSYVFGMSGDTPCLPACTVGIAAGPVASVGTFTLNTGTLSGTSDLNIASNNLANAALSGTAGAADTNGRVQLSMPTANTLNGVYPGDYAVYIVDANNAYVLSTDKHSAYILLAGSTQKQQVASFTSANVNGGFVGYENAPTNPGLVGATLSNVLNLSTATILRGTGDGAGTCTTTNVDQGGTTGLANGLTGLGSGSDTVNALLGTFASTGNSNCPITANGREVFNYPAPNTVLTGVLTLLGLPNNPPPARVAYLSNTNTGYFLETGYAGLGHLEQQVGSPYTAATLNGSFVYGTSPAASLASTNASGVFTADGMGSATTTLDENVGVGNVNALQLGTAGTYAYTLTDATAGRFLLGSSTVIYAIQPGRFVLLDTNATTTSPSTAILY